MKTLRYPWGCRDRGNARDLRARSRSQRSREGHRGTNAGAKRSRGRNKKELRRTSRSRGRSTGEQREKQRGAAFLVAGPACLDSANSALEDMYSLPTRLIGHFLLPFC